MNSPLLLSPSTHPVLATYPPIGIDMRATNIDDCAAAPRRPRHALGRFGKGANPPATGNAAYGHPKRFTGRSRVGGGFA